MLFPLSMALLTLANAQLAFGHVALLDHADFSLESGERVGLIGREALDPGRQLADVDQRPIGPPVVLEAGCDVGVSAVILPGVTVGRNAQVGAGAVVTADVPACAIVAGVPARVIGQR